MALKRLLEIGHGGGALFAYPRPKTLFEQAVFDGSFAFNIQTNLAHSCFRHRDVAVVFQAVARPDGDGLVGPVARRQQRCEVPGPVGIAELHGPEHPPFGIQQIGGTHATASRTRVLKSPLTRGLRRGFTPLRPTATWSMKDR